MLFSHRSTLTIGLGLLLLLTAVAGLFRYSQQRSAEAALVRAEPDQAIADAPMVRLAMSRGPDLYRRHCVECHGSDARGNAARGAPDLADSIWLFGFGDLTDIENTVTYGIRSGHPKSHNITDMPAIGRIGQLSIAETRDVVEYVYAFSHSPTDMQAVDRGRQLFMDKGNCYDCHAADARGNVDYGAPDLTGRGGWLYGGDRQSLYRSVYDGRHGLCPAWIRRLSAAQIRELSIYLYVMTHHSTQAPSGMTGVR